jgi:hypothetical protein
MPFEAMERMDEIVIAVLVGCIFWLTLIATASSVSDIVFKTNTSLTSRLIGEPAGQASVNLFTVCVGVVIVWRLASTLAVDGISEIYF